MGRQLLHSKIINAVAREVLRPLGVVQKGRSRLWLDDHGWWLALVEFQPSSWSRGTYLNVGVCWLWSEQGYFAFDLGHRVEPFVGFQTESQFTQEAHRIAERAAEQIRQYRDMCRSIYAVADLLAGEASKGGWALYHAAVAAGVAGRPVAARRFFRALDKEPSSFVAEDCGLVEREWHVALKRRAANLAESLSDLELFRSQVVDMIANTRDELKLKEWGSLVFEG